MTDPDILDTATELRTRSPERLWALSTESLYSSLAAKATGNPVQEFLGPHIRAETLRMNDERDVDPVVDVHEWLLEELDFVEGDDVTLLGMLVLTAECPQPLIRATAIAQFQLAEIILRTCSEADDDIPRRELDSLLADEWDDTVLAPLLGSLGFITIYRDSVDLEQEQIDSALSAQQSISTEKAVAESYRVVLLRVVDTVDEDCLEALVKRVSGSVPPGEVEHASVASVLAGTQTVVDEREIETAVQDLRHEYENDFDTVRSLLAPTTETDVSEIENGQSTGVDDVPNDVQLNDDERKGIINIVATVVAHPELATLDTRFVTERWPNVTPYTLYQALSSLPGVNCEVDDHTIEFRSVPKAIGGEDIREEYITDLVERCSTIQQRINALTGLSVSLPPEPVEAESMVVQDYGSIDRGAISPTYFTYTLVDPDALGEKKMDEFVGDSRGLGQERARLGRWHERRSTGLRSYTAMTDRLFSLGLERDIDDKILRIMTPFDDDTFNEYVAQIRRLLKNGFELHLLTRHTKDPWEWRRLQRNLLSEIKEHREQVTVRTYSRFKEHQRVTPNSDFRDLGEFGIHGKLQIVGAPEEGAALLGSANFMENSYDWNPECGVYTERTQFVDAAIEFFDIVWDISAADELSTERLQEIPDRQLVPTYYS